MKKKILGWSFRFVPKKMQRYPTKGDYQEKDGSIIFTITDTKNWKYNALLAIHELIEKLLNKSEGITDRQVDKWDFNFKETGEPGEHPKCPYQYQHLIATGVEKFMAKQLGVDWEKYNIGI